MLTLGHGARCSTRRSHHGTMALWYGTYQVALPQGHGIVLHTANPCCCGHANTRPWCLLFYQALTPWHHWCLLFYQALTPWHHGALVWHLPSGIATTPWCHDTSMARPTKAMGSQHGYSPRHSMCYMCYTTEAMMLPWPWSVLAFPSSHPLTLSPS